MVSKLKNLVSELGLIGTIFYICYRLCAKSGGLAALNWYLLVAQPIPKEPLLPARRGRSIMVRQVSVDDARLLSLPLDRKVIAFRARQGAICFAAFKDEVIIGCLWLCIAGYEEDEVRCRYIPGPPGQATWDFDVYVDPGHRSGLAFARLWDEANDWLRQRGVAYSWSRISAFNPGSLASHARLGAQITGKVTFFRLGPCQLMVASLLPHIHVSWRRKDMPLIHLNNPKR